MSSYLWGEIYFLFQIANHSGYVQVDWRKVEKDVNKAKKHLKKKANKAAPELNSFIEEVGILSYFHHHIPMYTKIVKPILYYYLANAHKQVLIT